MMDCQDLEQHKTRGSNGSFLSDKKSNDGEPTCVTTDRDVESKMEDAEITDDTYAEKKSPERDESPSCTDKALVAVSCTLSSFISLGVAFGLGPVYLDIKDIFNTSRPLAALVQSLCIGMGFGAGILTGPIIGQVGGAIITMSGSVLCCIGCIVGSFAPNIYVLIIGFGGLTGVGVSCLFLGVQVVMGTTFQKHRRLALPAISVGSGLGEVVFPILVRWLVNLYTLRGMFLILAGIGFQCFPFGVIYKVFGPVTNLTRKAFQEEILKLKEAESLSISGRKSQLTCVTDSDCRIQDIEEESLNGIPRMGTNVGDKGLTLKLGILAHPSSSSLQEHQQFVFQVENIDAEGPKDSEQALEEEHTNYGIVIQHNVNEQGYENLAFQEEDMDADERKDSKQEFNNIIICNQTNVNEQDYEKPAFQVHVEREDEEDQQNFSKQLDDHIQEHESRESVTPNNLDLVVPEQSLETAVQEEGAVSCDKNSDSDFQESEKTPETNSMCLQVPGKLVRQSSVVSISNSVGILGSQQTIELNNTGVDDEDGAPSRKISRSGSNTSAFSSVAVARRRQLSMTVAFQTDLIHNRRYVLVTVFCCVIFLTFNAGVIYLTDIVGERGLNVDQATYLMSILFACSVGGKALVAVFQFIRHFSIMVILGVAIFASSLASFGFTLVDYVNDDDVMAAYTVICALFGFFMGIVVTCLPLLCAELVEVTQYAPAMGYQLFIVGCSISIGGPFGGWIKDITGSYDAVFYILLAQGFIGLIVTLALTVCPQHCHQNLPFQRHNQEEKEDQSSAAPSRTSSCVFAISATNDIRCPINESRFDHLERRCSNSSNITTDLNKFENAGFRVEPDDMSTYL